MRITRFIPGLITCLFFAALETSQAQQTNSSVRPFARAQGGNGFNGGQGVAGFALGGPVAVLDDQQRASYESIMNGQRGRLAELQSKLRAARQDLVATSVDQKFDENVIRQKALVIARIDAEMTVLRIKVFSQVQPPLTPEQIAKVKTGEPGPIHTVGQQQVERAQRRQTSAGTNYNDNGLPPKK
jgi:Spy/CpxP family protein refolding chaperone